MRLLFRSTFNVRCSTLDVFFSSLSLRPSFAPSRRTRQAATAHPLPFPLTNLSPVPSFAPPRNWIDQTRGQADAKSAGCIQCHKGIEPMHAAEHVVLGCTDCHGGNPARGLTKEQAHVPPRPSRNSVSDLGQSRRVPTSGSITNRRSSSAS